KQILVTFNEAVDSSSLNQHDFDVEINGSKQTVTDAVPGSEDGEVLVTLDKTVSAEQSATVTVIPGNDGKVKIADTAGNTAEEGSSVTATKSKVVEGGSGEEEEEEIEG